jgi:two-component system chemotaxis sensor kinase CheA
MSFDLSQFYQVFFEEASEHLASMESMLLALNVSDPSMDDLNAIFRSAHSIKGGAGTFGFSDMTEVTHVLETLLDKLRKQEMNLTTEMVDVFLQAGDAIAMQLAAHRGEGEVDQAEISAVCEKLEQLSSAHDTPAVTGDAAQPAKGKAKKSQPKITGKKGKNKTEAAVVEDDYGFFDDISTPATVAAQDDQGYGFFGDAPRQIMDFCPLTAPQQRRQNCQRGRRLAARTQAHPTRRAAIERHRPPVNELQYASA